MTIEYDPFESIIFLYRHGCSACDAAMPELDKFMMANPRIMVVKLDADGPFVERMTGMRKVEATPVYVYRRGNGGVSLVGAMKNKDIERWLKRIREAQDDDQE